MEEDDFPLKEGIVINYTLSEGDVVLVSGWGFKKEVYCGD